MLLGLKLSFLLSLVRGEEHYWFSGVKHCHFIQKPISFPLNNPNTVHNKRVSRAQWQ